MEVALEEKSLPLLWLVDLTLKAAGRRMVFASVVQIIKSLDTTFAQSKMDPKDSVSIFAEGTYEEQVSIKYDYAILKNPLIIPKRYWNYCLTFSGIDQTKNVQFS